MKRFHNAMFYLAASALLVGVFGCSNPKAASKSNFKHSINAFYDQNPACIGFTHMPIKVYTSGLMFAVPSSQQDALVSAGLLKVSPGSETGSGFVNGRATYKLYSLTDEGKAQWRKTDPANPGSGQFCFARRHVTNIVQYTVPASGNAGSATATVVSYRYDFAGIPGWARNPAVLAAYPAIKQVTQTGTQNGNDTLVLMNTGWVVQPSLLSLF